MGKRIINTGGGAYHAKIAGNYIEGKEVTDDKQDAHQKKEKENTIDVDVISAEVVTDKNVGETINTNGANYTEKIKGGVIRGDVYRKRSDK